MELTITEKRDNPVLGRTEVHFTISHPKAGTPARAEIRKALAQTLNAKEGVVVLDWARSEFGRTATRGYAKLYESKDLALKFETGPILVRNGLKAKAVAKEAAQAPAEPPKKEAPKKEVAPKKEEAPKKQGVLKKEEAPKEKKPAAKKETR